VQSLQISGQKVGIIDKLKIVSENDLFRITLSRLSTLCRNSNPNRKRNSILIDFGVVTYSRARRVLSGEAISKRRSSYEIILKKSIFSTCVKTRMGGKRSGDGHLLPGHLVR